MSQVTRMVKDRVPQQVRGYEYILIEHRGKKPLHRWKQGKEGARLYRFNHPELQAHVVNGGNLAIHFNHGLLAVDVDETSAISKVVEALPETFTVSTSRGQHLYLTVPDWVDGCIEIEGVGDIKAVGGYCLIPPSIHPSGARYTVERDISVAETTAEDLREALEPFGVESEAERRRRRYVEKEMRRMREGSAWPEKSRSGARPCIRRLIDTGPHVLDGAKGHKARLAIAVELLAEGFAVKEVIDVFQDLVTDFDKRITERQVNQIAATGYTPFKCSTLQRDTAVKCLEKCGGGSS